MCPSNEIHQIVAHELVNGQEIVFNAQTVAAAVAAETVAEKLVPWT